MAAEPIGALHVQLSAGDAEFKNDMYRARKAVEENATGMQKAMMTAKRGFDNTVASIKLLSVAAAGAAVIVGRMVLKQADQAQQAIKTAQSVGLTVESLTALQYVADQSGVSQQQLTTALTIAAKNAELAAKGTGSAKDAYASLGISVMNASGELKSSDVLIGEVAERFAKMEDGAKKTALATQMFGRQGAALIPLLNSGRDGIKELTDEAAKLGLVLDTETARTAERFSDNLTRLKGVQQGVVISLTRELLPTLEVFTDQLVDSAKKTDGFSGAAKLLNGALTVLIATGTSIASIFKLVGTALGGAGALTAGFFDALRGKSSFSDLNQLRKEIKGDLSKIVTDMEKDVEQIMGASSGKMKGTAEKAGRKAGEGFAEGLAAGVDDKLGKRGAEAIASMVREIALLGKKTELEKTLWEIEAGKYADLLPKDRQRLELLARELAQNKEIIKSREDAVEQLKKEVDEGVRLTDEIIKEVEALQREADIFGMTADEVKLYDLALKGASAAQLEHVSVLMQELKVREQVAEVLNTIRTPMEDYIARVRMLSDLLAVGAITQDEFTAAVKAAKDALKEAAKVEKAEFKTLGDMIDSVTSDGANAIMEFARTGEFSVKKMVDAMITDLLRLSLQQATTSLAGGLKNVLGVAVTAIGGFLGSAQGNVFNRGELIPFARGGVVSQATVFPMSRGMGIMGEAGPEAILPLTRTSSGELGVRADVDGGGGEQTVNNYFVINSPDSEGFDRLCQRNAISIVRATNSALEKNVGRNQMKGLLGG